MSTPFLTLFSTPKPMSDPHIATIQRNAFASWRALGEDVAIALIGEEEGLEEAAAEFGFIYLPKVERNASGTPLISSIFSLGRGINDSPCLAYVNADILLFPDFVEAIHLAKREMDKFLMVGQRYDLDLTEELTLDEDWQMAVRRKAVEDGKQHVRAGSDYFAYPRGCFDSIPQFSVGRAGWDNWMIFRARKMKWPVLDATNEVLIIHQNHDYRHLPEGKPHYQQPETGENIRLAGGRRVLFDLDDATHVLEDGKVVEFPRSAKKFWREFEITPLLKWRAYGLTQFLFSLFHSKRARAERKKERALRASYRTDRKVP